MDSVDKQRRLSESDSKMEVVCQAMQKLISREIECSVEDYRYLEHLNHTCTKYYGDMNSDISTYQERLRNIQQKCNL